MAITYLGNSGDDIFTLGSNHVSTVSGQDGADVIRITTNQTRDVDATADNTQTIVFEAGVDIASVSSALAGVVPTVITLTNGAVIDAHASTTFQMGTQTFTGAELIAAHSGGYVVTGNETDPAATNPAFTVSADASQTVTQAVSTDVVSNASVVEVDGASVQGATLTVAFDSTGTIQFDTDVTRYDDNLVISGNIVATLTTDNNSTKVMTLADDVTTAEVEALLNSIKRTSTDVGEDNDLTITITNGSATGSADVEITTTAATPVAFTSLTGNNQYPTVVQAATAIDNNATVNTNASFGDDLNGGTLTIALGTGTEATDVLSLPVATGGDIMVVDGNVYYNAGNIAETSADTLVGTITGNNTAGENLVITFNGSTTQAAVNAILQEVTFDANDTTGTDGVRYIDYTLAADGQTATGQAALAVSSSTITMSDYDANGNVADANGTFPSDAESDDVVADGINVFLAADNTFDSEDDIDAGNTEFDIIQATVNAEDVNATVDNVEVFEITNNATAGRTINFSNTTNTDGNDMTVKLTGDQATSLTNLDGVTSVDLSGTTDVAKTVTITTDDSQTVAITAGEALIDLTGNLSSYTIDATSLNNDVSGVTVAGSSSVTINNAVTNIVATTNTGALTVNLADNTDDNDITVTTGTANTTVASVASGDTVTVNADAMADDTTLTVSGSGAVAIDNAEANIDLTNLVGDDVNGAVTVDIDLKDITDDEATITLGALNIDTTDAGQNDVIITGGNAGDSIVIDATAAVTEDANTDGVVDADENVDITLDGSVTTATVNGLSADLTDNLTAGNLVLNTVAGAAIAVTGGVASVTTTFGGTASSVAINASSSTGDFVFGDATTDYTANVTVTNAGNAAIGDIDATYLTGALTVTAASGNATNIILGDGVTTATITGDTTASTIDATDFTGTLYLQGDAQQTLTAVETDIMATADLTNDSTNNPTSLSGALIATLVDDANVTVTAGSANTTINASADADSDGSVGSVTLDLTAMATGATADVVDHADGNLNVTATGLVGTLDLSANAIVASATTVSVTTADDSGDSSTVVLGTDQTVSITGTDASDTVTVTATAAIAGDFDADGATPETNVQLTIDGASAWDINGASADLIATNATGIVNYDASAATNDLSITTGSGADIIAAGSGDDTISAGAGNDTITGGEGVDTMTGGAGTDTFVITGNGDGDTAAGGIASGTIDTGYGSGNRDIIVDFVINSDVIDLTNMYKDSEGDGSNDDGAAGVAVAYADLSISKGPESTIITIDTNGDTLFDNNDVQIELTGNFGGYDINASSFLFA